MRTGRAATTLPPVNPFIVNLSDCASTIPAAQTNSVLSAVDLCKAEYGEKAWRLSVMANAGLPVPDGFVLTCTAFRQFSAHDHGDLERHLHLAFDDHFPAHAEVAVRSSACGEDSARGGEESTRGGVDDTRGGVENQNSQQPDASTVSTSYAGQHDTLYFVTRESLARAVIKVWQSLDKSADYRARMGITDTPEMAVIVQTLIEPEVSGVCFARDPTGLTPNAIIESSWGLGAAVVDGRVTPDRFELNQDGELIACHTARKDWLISNDGFAGTRLQSVPTDRKRATSLDETQTRSIWALTRQCSELFGSPQDVEWAIDKAGVLHALQSRPFTIAEPIEDNVDGEWVIFKPIVENFTEPMTPLSVDLFRQVIPGFGRFINGRLYVNGKLAKTLLPFRLSREEWADVLLLRRPSPPTIHWPKAALLVVIALLSYPVWGIFAQRARRVSSAQFEAFAELSERMRRSGRNNAPMVLRKLFLGGSPFRRIGLRVLQANVAAGRYFLYTAWLKALLERFAPGLVDADKDLALLTQAGEDLKSRDLVDGIRHLANVASASAQVTAALTDTGDDREHAQLARVLHGTAFEAALDEFMAQFGHRCTGEVELMSPRWREDPGPVLAMVRTFMASRSDVRELHGEQLAAMDRLHQSVSKRWQRRLIDTLIDEIRDLSALRENTRHYHILLFDTLRSKILQREQQLLASGSLKCPDDIFFLHWPEIEKLLSTEWRWENVEPIIRSRRARHLAWSRRPPMMTINMLADIDVSTRELSGLCASPGIAEGPARVIRQIGADTRLEPGEILVAPYTDPMWTPLFPAAAAVVVEVGSYLSHAGTVAREYGVPCIVDVAGALNTIANGDMLRINATDGTITHTRPGAIEPDAAVAGDGTKSADIETGTRTPL